MSFHPFIETLSIPQLVTPILAVFVLMTAVRTLLWGKWTKAVEIEHKVLAIYKMYILL